MSKKKGFVKDVSTILLFTLLLCITIATISAQEDSVPVVRYDDDFTTEGGSREDSFAFVGGVFRANLTLLGYPPFPPSLEDVDVECWFFDRQSYPDHPQECFARTTQDMQTCRQYIATLETWCTNGSADCSGPDNIYTGAIGGWHNEINFGFPTSDAARVQYFGNCGPSWIGEHSSQSAYSIVSKKRAMCNNQQDIRYEGWRGEAWGQYSSGACPSGSTCQPSLAGQEVTTQNGVIPSPCASECPGSAQVIVLDSAQRGLANIKVFVGENLEGTTGSSGLLQVSLSGGSSCGQPKNVTVRCSDNTFCGSKLVTINFPNETESIMFDCTRCIGTKDLFIGQQDVFITSSGALSVINATVHSVNLAANNNLTVRFQTIGKDGLVKETTDKTLSINSNSETSTSASFNLYDRDYITVYVDPNKRFPESKANNFVQRRTVKRIKAYFDVNTGITKANEAITEFLESFAEPVSENDADVVIAVGRFSQNIANDIINKESFIRRYGWGFRNEKVFANGRSLALPYNGVVGAYRPLAALKVRLVALGTDIDGTIAAVKRMAAAGNVYFTPLSNPYGDFSAKPLIILDRFDRTAVNAYDILHNFENANSYLTNTEAFKTAIAKVLSGNAFDVAIRQVNTTNAQQVALRIKNVNSEVTAAYKDQVVENPMPIVFSGGLFSDLFRWEQSSLLGLSKGLAKQMVEEGRDSWEIEITGGPLIERPSDPNYNYTDLVDSYWPASLAAIQYYTNRITTQYVGHSNGCRVALSSLEKYQTTGKSNVAKVQNLQTGQYVTVNLQGSQSAPVVDTFVGTGCPGAFEGNFPFLSFPWAVELRGARAIQNLELTQNMHPNRREILTAMFLTSPGGFNWEGRVSLNLLKDYKTFIDSAIDPQPGDFSANRTLIVAGDTPAFAGTDFVVTVEDNRAVLNRVTANVKVIANTTLNHFFLVGDDSIKSRIKQFLGGG